MRHKKYTFLLMLVLSVSCFKSSAQQFCSDVHSSSEKKIKTKIVKLKRKELIIGKYRVIGISLGIFLFLKSFYTIIKNKKTSLDECMCEISSFIIPLLFFTDGILSTFDDWTQEDIKELEDEIASRKKLL